MGSSVKLHRKGLGDLQKKLPNEPQHELDVRLTREALELAGCGIGLVSPNPLVGCVIADVNGEIVGRGFYQKENVTHAEVIALSQAGEKARGGSAYVSLEPHDHFGQTPPCTDALIDAGISRVVCPIEDPNPLVSGNGFEKLKSAGIDVVTGILADNARRQNEKFICWHKLKRPFVHLKMAMSLDGRISMGKSVSTTLSGCEASTRVHELRHEYDAILVGSNTVLVDDPNLTDRSGRPRRRPLARIVLDNSLRVSKDSKLALTIAEAPTIVFTGCIDTDLKNSLIETGVQVVALKNGTRDLTQILKELYDREIQSLLVEGGSEVAAAFVESGFVDKVTFIYSPIIIGGPDAPFAIGGKGVSRLSDAVKLRNIEVRRLGNDIEVTGYPFREDQ